MHKACNAQAVFRFIVLDGVAAGNDAAGLHSLGVSTLKNRTNVLCGKTVWHAQKVHGELRLAAHGVNVAQRVRCGDLPEKIGIVYDRREEVHGLDNGRLIGNAVNAGIIAAVEADQQARIRHVRQVCKNFRKDTRPQFCRSTCGARHLRETQLVVHAHTSLLRIFPSRAKGAARFYFREERGLCQSRRAVMRKNDKNAVWRGKNNQ